ncbi:MAG: YjbQ family protein [Candidatus Wildermuthbacteria bacterium]|nr:YjbQ family protein [Candidatus Wildermuthbacteria bacterium]
MEEIIIKTKKEREIVDITAEVQKIVGEKGIKDGVCHLFVVHTSAALTTADLDEGTDLDMLDAFELVVPALKYRHPHKPEHVKYHILTSIIGPSLCIPVEKGELMLGPWQKVILIELGGPRERNITVHCA